MKKNELKPFFSGALVVSLGLITTLTQAVPAYIPQALRECVMQAAENGISNEWQELRNMIAENRILASDKLVRKAVEDRLNWSDENSSSSNYLREYLANMNQRSILLALQGNDAQLMLFPTDLVVRSFEDAANMDMVYLSNQLAVQQNVELCGCADINAAGLLQELHDVARAVPTLNQPNLIFNANMIMSPLSPTPNIILGTGITSPLIPAWIMSPSAQTQYPVSIQFPLPDNLRTDRDMELIFHFLATKQNAAGAIKVRINGSWQGIDEEFASDDMVFVAESDNISVVEPTSANLIRHVYASVLITSDMLAGITRTDFVRLAFTRVHPRNATEYARDIYLAAVEFRYTGR